MVDVVGVAETSADERLVPDDVMAQILYTCVVPVTSFVWEYFVVEFCVLGVSVSNCAGPFLTSILQPTIVLLVDGAVQERLICVGETGVATRFVGGFTVVALVVAGGMAFDVDSGVAYASADLGLAPSVKYADTTYVQVLPVVSPVMAQVLTEPALS